MLPRSSTIIAKSRSSTIIAKSRSPSRDRQVAIAE
jgi:hypothetical protein